jgi:ribosomal-protein-alanine N-acetyltransferase
MIRPYHPADRGKLLELFRLNSPAAFAPSEENDFRHYLDQEREDYFVLDRAGEILACGGINYPDGPETARISWDMVDPKHQGEGLGQKLLRYRLENIREKQRIKRITVRTSQLAYRFYEKEGFALMEIIPGYWGEGFDLYRMELHL